MGYTHYWIQTRDLTADEFLEIGAVVTKLISAAEARSVDFHDYSDASRENGYAPVLRRLPVKIRGGLGEGDPQIDAETIWLNGDGPKWDHETFHLSPKRVLPYDGADPDRLGWDFCKTARKPYDVVVVATLAYLAAKWGFEVSSDGDPSDWVEGVALASSVVGEPIPCPIEA